jgi:hypothetical protein
VLSLGYAWQKRFATLERADVKRLRQVELRVRLANEYARYRYGQEKSTGAPRKRASKKYEVSRVIARVWSQ